MYWHLWLISVTDLGEIFTRLFDARPFLGAELKYFVREFEVSLAVGYILIGINFKCENRPQEKRKDREVEGLFTTLQNTIEIRDVALQKCTRLSETHLPDLRKQLDKSREVFLSIEQITGAADAWVSLYDGWLLHCKCQF